MSTVTDPMDLGDAFALVYDALEGSRPTAIEMDTWPTTDPCRRTRQHVMDTARPDLTLPGALVQEALDDGPAAMYGLLLAVDLLLSRANGPTAPAQGDRLGFTAWTRRIRHGRYNRMGGTGAVLPRRTTSPRPLGGPESLREAFGILRVSPETWSGTRYIRVPKELDHSAAASDGLSLAALPMGADSNDIVMASETLATGRRIYTARPSDHVIDHVASATGALAGQGIDVGLIPEITLDADVLRAWQTHLTDGAPTWVLAGTGPIDDPTMPGASSPNGIATTSTGAALLPNRAVLLHGPTGRIVAVQDKQYGFTIAPTYLSAYQLGSAPHEMHSEGMADGRDTTVIESNAGRFGIFVCEDIGRLTSLASTVQELGLTHILVPILATPIQRYRWQERAADHLALYVGTTTIVFNSLTLGRWHPGTRRGAYTLLASRPDLTNSATTTSVHRNPHAASMTDHEDALTPRHTRVNTS
jgi:hypothetical protein